MRCPICIGPVKVISAGVWWCDDCKMGFKFIESEKDKWSC